MIKLLFPSLAIAATMLLAGCDSKDPSATGVAQTSVSQSSPTDSLTVKPTDTSTAGQAGSTTSTASSQFKDVPLPVNSIAVITTNLGVIKFKFLTDKAPETTKNFVKLASSGFYDGTLFHRVIPGFMIQGGDPNSKSGDRSTMGAGGPGYSIKAEFNDQPHVRGIVSMARSQDPDSAGSQFFIVVKDSNFLDHQYTAFGQVTAGMDVVDKIVNLKRDERDNPLPSNPAKIISVKIEKS